jgi:hypothetical protein
MNKVINVLAAFFLLCGFLVVPAPAVAVSDLDQYQTDHNSWNYISTHQYVVQTFKPGKNRLNKIQLKVRGAGDLLAIQMTKTGSSTILLPGVQLQNTTVDADFRWYEFAFSDVAVTIGDSYSIWVGASGNSRWSIHNTSDELYANGRAYKDCAIWVTNLACMHPTVTADWTFKTFGYSTELPPAPAAPPAPLPAATTAEKPAEQTTVALKPPVLTSLAKNETNVKLPVEDTVTMSKAGTLNLAGTAAADMEVDVALGEETFSSTTDKDGKWKLALELKDVKVGEYTVKGKVVSDGKASSEAEFFKLKVEDAAVVNPNAVETAGWFTGWNIFYTLIGVGVLLLILLLLAVIARRHHHEKTGGQSDDDKKDEPKEEVAEVVETEEPQIVKGKKSKNK